MDFLWPFQRFIKWPPAKESTGQGLNHLVNIYSGWFKFMVDVDVNIPYILKARRGQHALPRRFWGVKLTPCKSSKRLVDLVDFDDTCLLGKKTISRMLHAFPKKRWIQIHSFSASWYTSRVKKKPTRNNSRYSSVMVTQVVFGNNPLHKSHAKNPLSFHYTGSLNRDPHNGLLQSPHNWVGFHPLYNLYLQIQLVPI